MKTIGQNIASCRERAGLTQTQLQAACGWGEGNGRINNYEKGRRKPDIDDLLVIANALSVTRTALLGDDDSVMSGTASGVATRPVPVVGTAQLGDKGYWEELAYPVGHGDGVIDYPTNDPEAYAVKFNGHSMAPRYKHGEYGIIEPNTAVCNGDEVLVKTTDGRSMIKVFAYEKMIRSIWRASTATTP